MRIPLPTSATISIGEWFLVPEFPGMFTLSESNNASELLNVWHLSFSEGVWRLHRQKQRRGSPQTFSGKNLEEVFNLANLTYKENLIPPARHYNEEARV